MKVSLAYKYNSNTYKDICNKVLGRANQEVDKLDYLEQLLDLDDDLQENAFTILWQAFKKVLKKRIELNKIIDLPYTGKLKIKSGNKFGIINKSIVAKELGYDNWNSLPKNKLEEALIKVRLMTIKDLNRNRAIKKRKKGNINLELSRIKICKNIL